MNKATRISLTTIILLFSSVGFAQVGANTGTICKNEIKAALEQLANQTDNRNSLKMENNVNFSEIYRDIARGEMKNTTEPGSPLLQLTAISIDAKKAVWVLTYHSDICEYQRKLIGQDSNELKEALRDYIRGYINSVIRTYGGTRSFQ